MMMPNLNDPRLPARFWAKVRLNEETGCWEWVASKRRRGYGRFGSKNNQRAAHRVSYEALIGPIPDGMDLDHLCRVPHCVNPAHLEPITHQENIKRSYAARLDDPAETARARALQEAYRAAPRGIPNALKTHCPRGHEYTPDNIIHKPGNGRQCRACTRMLAAKYKEAKRAARAQIDRVQHDAEA